MTRSVSEAYSSAGPTWQSGPGLVYDVLAEHLISGVHVAPDDLVLDIGAGTGAATRPLLHLGACVVPIDVAHGMLIAGRSVSLAASPAAPPGVVGDACALPFADASFDVAIAAFVLNHVDEPVRALAEIRRVLHRGGRFAASVYAADDTHPAKGATDAAAAEFGWQLPTWFADMRGTAMAALATPDRVSAAMHTAGLSGEGALVRVAVPGLTPTQMVDWRLGMAHLALFVAELDDDAVTALRRRAVELLGPNPDPLVRHTIELRGVR